MSFSFFKLYIVKVIIDNALEIKKPRNRFVFGELLINEYKTDISVPKIITKKLWIDEPIPAIWVILFMAREVAFPKIKPIDKNWSTVKTTYAESETELYDMNSTKYMEETTNNACKLLRIIMVGVYLFNKNRLDNVEIIKIIDRIKKTNKKLFFNP